MVLSYASLSSNEKALRIHTGLSQLEFEHLHVSFSLEWQSYISSFTCCGKEMKRHTKGRKNSVLPTLEDKLLFILFYLKANPLQEVLAATLSMDQPQAHRWPEVLRPSLLATLGKQNVLPERDAERLSRAVGERKMILIDAIERLVGRSKNQQVQEEYFSGKKRPTRSRT
ncbi:MAG: transposase family protein [Flavobacterium sp.]|nr:MAG: transposase family protein [Flavobacterium sp.]